MVIEVEVAGNVLEFPDGTSPDVMKQKASEFAASRQPQEQVPTTSVSRTVLEQGLQGATFGFADEVSARIGAGIAKAFGGEDTANISFDELVNQGLELQRAELQSQQEERPILSLVSQLGGAIVTGGASASTKVGQAVAGRVAASSLKGRAAAGAAIGATGGGAFGLGTAEGEFQERLPQAAEGAAIGAATGGVIPTISPIFKAIAPKAKNAAEAAKRAIARRKINTTTPLNSETIKGFSSQAYNEAAELGGVLNEEFTDSVIAKAKQIAPQTKAGKLLGGDSQLSKIINNLEGLQGQRLNLQSADEIDKFLTKTRDNLLDAGRETAESREIGVLQDIFRESIESATEKNIVGGKEGFETLKKARKLWSAQARMRDVENIVERAELMDNPRTALKTGFRQLLLNKKRMRGFTEAERKLVKKAAQTGVISGALNTLGSNLIPIAVGSTGFVTGGIGGAVAAAPAFALSSVARSAASKLQEKKAINILRKIQQGVLD